MGEDPLANISEYDDIISGLIKILFFERKSNYKLFSVGSASWALLVSLLQQEWELWQHVKEGLKIMQSARNSQHQQNSAAEHNSCGEERCAYRFVLLDWFEELINTSANSVVVARWRPLLQVEARSQQEANKTRNGSAFSLVPLVPLLKDWARIKKEGATCEFGDYDSCADSEQTGKSLRGFCRFTLSLLCPN